MHSRYRITDRSEKGFRSKTKRPVHFFVSLLQHVIPVAVPESLQWVKDSCLRRNDNTHCIPQKKKYVARSLTGFTPLEKKGVSLKNLRKVMLNRFMRVVPNRRNSSLTGFTLIELLLVLTLLGIFVGLVIPRVGNLFFDYEFHSSVERIEKMIRFAQQDAVNKELYYRLTIDRTENALILETKSPDSKGDYSPVPGKIGEEFELPKLCEFSSLRSDAIYFFPDGSTSRAQFAVRYKDDEKVTFKFKGTPFGFSLKYS